MLKKILASAGIFLAATSSVLAGQYYIGPGLTLDNLSSSSHRSYQGISPRLIWGYGDLSGRSYLAGEFVVTAGSIVLNNRNKNKLNLKTTNGIGFGFMAGLLMKEKFVGYLRAGYLFSYFSSARQYRPGIQAGLGLQADVAQNWVARVEYDYTVYSSTAALGAPRNNQLGVSVLYKFS